MATGVVAPSLYALAGESDVSEIATNGQFCSNPRTAEALDHPVGRAEKAMRFKGYKSGAARRPAQTRIRDPPDKAPSAT
jgi:hypothetical protein